MRPMGNADAGLTRASICRVLPELRAVTATVLAMDAL